LTRAEQQSRYRKRKLATGTKAARGKRLSLFERGEFVAVDGEGVSEGPEIVRSVPSSGAEYRGRAHYYHQLSASDGSEILSRDGRLTAAQCLDFLIDIELRNPGRVIPVIFYGSYDVTQMLAHDLPRDQLAKLLKPAGLGQQTYAWASFGTFDYRLEYHPRKMLRVWRWPRGAVRYRTVTSKNGAERRVMCNHVSVTLWDVGGFFQESFAATLAKWMPDDPDRKMIADMKALRSTFRRDQLDDIRLYTAAELRCLVALMDGVRDACRNMGLVLKQWHGAGAIASAMMTKNRVKDHMAASPAGVFEAARGAFSGGHIEIFKIGHHAGRVHHYDINSAYPDVLRWLPSLAGGSWRRGRGTPPPGFTVVRVAYHFADGMPFYPLFYREPSGRIIYPPRGKGWHWFPEYEAARVFAERFGATRFDVLDWYHLTPADATARPFAWIEGYYERRKFLVETSALTGIPNGEEKILKLGYNACYGKTIQQIGAKVQDDGSIRPPSFFQIEWGGYVTAGCRAAMMMAAMQKPHAIVAIATDGIFATEPLDLHCPPDKQLGAWEYKQHDGITMVMPGVYWLHDGDRDTLHSRGFDKEQFAGAATVLAAWRKRQSRLAVKLQRLIGLGSALTSDVFWDMRGMFVATTKDLALNGDNSKRYPAMLYRLRPDLGLVDTDPRDHYGDLFADADDFESGLYPVDWLPKEARADWLTERDIEAARFR
jgi:hypothetical protein